ncbi:MAG: exodeoxyribonuclease VII small subunit [Coriobacteriia bacterium]|nr:exodeoxyribonuclease VII small subunit [Coriobacteriia bacterium]
MADETYTFTQARARLEEIVAQVRKKDVSLEKSLDLLEEGVRLANICTELSDHTEWRTVVGEQAVEGEETLKEGADAPAASPEEADESTTSDASTNGEEKEDRGDGQPEDVFGAPQDGSSDSMEEPVGTEEKEAVEDTAPA